MSVSEIIYLDSGRLTSILSQLVGGVSERGSETQTESVQSRVSFVGHDPFDEVASPAARVSGQLAHVREVRYFDHLLSQFMGLVESNIIDLEATELRSTADQAIEKGSLVKASGPFFLDDFESIAKSLSNSPKYFRLAEVASKLSSEVGSGVDDSGARRRRKQALAAAEAKLKGPQEMLLMLAAAMEAMYGDAVECGVGLLGPPAPHLVRALLDRGCLRESTSSLVQRYGTKSAIRFTIIGTITKTSWQGLPTFAAEESAESSQGIRDMIHTAQGVIDDLREQVMTVGSGDSVSVAPIAIYRDLEIRPL